MEKVHANIVLEILGRPVEHVTQALNDLLKRLGSEQGVTIIEQTAHPPLSVPDAKDLFTSFAEVTLELDSLSRYFAVLFAYMPANSEIISPANFKLSNVETSQLGAKLIQRLHDYDAVVKRMIVDRDILAQKLKEVAPHLFKQKKDSQPDTK